MKKIKVFVVTVLLIFTANSAWAGGLTLGVEYNSSEKDMKQTKGSMTIFNGAVTTETDFPSDGESINKAKAKEQSLFIKSSFVIGGENYYIAPYVKAGVAELSYSYEYASVEGEPTDNETVGKGDFAWGVGFSSKIAEIKKISILVDAEYSVYDMESKSSTDGISTEDLVRRLFEYWGYPTIEMSYSESTKVSKWHTGLTATKTIGIFTPYAGVRYSSMTIVNKGSITVTADGILPYTMSGSEKLKSKKNVGAVVGTDIHLSKHFSVNVEGHFIDETSGKIGVNYNF